MLHIYDVYRKKRTELEARRCGLKKVSGGKG